MIKLVQLLVVSALLFSTISAQRSTVYKADIEGDIDLGLAPYVKRVVDEAAKNNAAAIIFRINTFGGRVDAATKIKDAILNSKVKTIAFIDKRAISAGALIALSCEKIVMAPGAAMGATTVVDGTGQKQSEKYQSYMRSEMRATAEKNGRRTDIAQGMVDETVVVPDLNDNEKTLITLTSEEAVKYGIADTVLSSIDQVKELYGFKDGEEISLSSNWAENFVRFLNHPVVSTLLILIGMIGIITEIKMGVWGFPGTIAVIALALFFGSGYILDLASVLEIVIFILGVILLLLEIFVIPGFGIVGVVGILFMIAGLFFGLVSDFGMSDYSLLSVAITQLASVFVLSAIFIFVLSKLLPKSALWNRLILQTDISDKSGYAANQSFEHLIGAEGIALTTLRPAGSAIINGQRIDVVTEGDYVNHDTKIIVKAVEGSKIVVGVKE